MALTDAFPGASGAVDSTELRKNLAGLIVRDTAGNARPGIFPRHTNALVTGRSDMALNVAAFEGASVRGGGPLFIANDGATTSPALAAAPSSNSRIDVLYFKQNESASPYGDADNLPKFGVVTGTAAPVPTKPALTVAGAVELATITIPSTATTTLSAGVVITQTSQYTATTGGTVLFRTTAERDLFTAADGTGALLIDTGAVQLRSGGTWVPVGGAMPGGRIKRSATAAVFTSSVWTICSAMTYWATDQPATGITAFNGLWTCALAGVYEVEGGILMDSAVNAIIAIKKNDVNPSVGGIVAAVSAVGLGGLTVGTVKARVRLSVGDTLTLAVFPSATATWSTAADASFFGLRYVEPLR